MKWPLDLSALEIVGFSGAALPQGAGLKAPVFCDRTTGAYFTGDPEASIPPRAHHDRRELEEFAARGLLTLVATPWPYAQRGVVIYAGPRFIEPDTAGSFVLPDEGLHLDTTVPGYLDFADRTWALSVLYRWGRRLIQFGVDQLHSEDRSRGAPLALDASRRARFCALQDVAFHHELRTDAFACGLAALRATGASATGWLRDAQREFTAEQVRRIEERAAHWLGPAQPTRTRPQVVSLLVWGIPHPELMGAK